MASGPLVSAVFAGVGTSDFTSAGFAVVGAAVVVAAAVVVPAAVVVVAADASVVVVLLVSLVVEHPEATRPAATTTVAAVRALNFRTIAIRGPPYSDIAAPYQLHAVAVPENCTVSRAEGAPVPLGPVNTLALMPDFLDPVKLIGYFGPWALIGLLVVVFIESGVLFPVLPGDTLLFVAGMLAAGTAAAAHENANFQLWQLLLFIPIAAVLGGQAGYFIGRFIGLEMFKPDARFLKQKYLDEAHAFFEQRGPFAIVLGRFVPIVRTLVPLTAGAAKMSYGVFTLFNVIGAVVWSTVLVLLGYFLGQFAIIQKLIEPIFILIAVLSALPIFFEWRKRRRAEKSKPAETDVSQENVE